MNKSRAADMMPPSGDGRVASPTSNPLPGRQHGLRHTGRLTAESEQALLDILAGQGIPSSQFAVILVIALINFNAVPTGLLSLWIVVVVILQIIRFIWFPALARAQSGIVGQRLASAAWYAVPNGLLFGGSTLFFPYTNEVVWSIQSMILFGIVAGSIATTCGYSRLFVGFTAPCLGLVALAWTVVPSTLSLGVALGIATLIILLGLVLTSVANQTFHAFVERFAISHALSISNEQLESALASERTASAAKTRFLAAASHDLRQPLHTLSLLSAALTMRKLDDKSASIAASMNEAMADLAAELDTLLDISKLDAGVMQADPESFDVAQALEKMLDLYEAPARRKSLLLQKRLDEDLYVWADRSFFDRIVRNLIDNAVKYSEDGSITLTCRQANGMALIAVTDTGIGIAAELQQQVFEEFYQVHNPERDKKKGLGLGLSIVRRLVELMGGTINLESIAGSGTTIQIFLPLADRPLAPKKQNASPQVVADRRVLIVDDDAGVRLGARTLLEQAGCLVEEATGTQSALQRAAEFHPHVALIDLRLRAGDDGIHVVRALQERYPALRIVIVSGETSPARLRQADDLGLTFLVKPVNETTLIQAVARQGGADDSIATVRDRM